MPTHDYVSARHLHMATILNNHLPCTPACELQLVLYATYLATIVDACLSGSLCVGRTRQLA